MRKNLSLILSLLALVGVVVLAGLWWCHSVSLTDVSLDTFIGVMVGMVGILVTFAIGWQIINALEIKSKLADIERLKTEIDAQHARIEKIAARSAFDSAINRSYTLYKTGEHVKAFVCTLQAIEHCLKIDEYEDLDILLKNLVTHAANSYNQHCYKSDREEMIKADAAIRQAPKFILIKDRYEAAIREYNMFPKYMLDDKKEK